MCTIDDFSSLLMQHSYLIMLFAMFFLFLRSICRFIASLLIERIRRFATEQRWKVLSRGSK